MKLMDRFATIIGTLLASAAITAFAIGVTRDPNDTIRFGRTTSSDDKKIIAEKNLGAANPALRVGSGGVWQVANDGVTFNQISDFSNTVRLTTNQTVAGEKTFSDTSGGTTIAKFGSGSAFASASDIGLVSTAPQTFAGLKSFPDKFLGHPSITVDTAATGALTLSTYYTYFTSTNITASRNIKFPSTAKAGEVWWIFVPENGYTSAQLLPVANDNSNIGSSTGDDNITNGYLALQATQDTPTTSSHWRLVTISDSRKRISADIPLTYSSNGTALNNGTTGGSTSLYLSKVDNDVTIIIDTGLGATAPSVASPYVVSAAGAVPAGFRPSTSNTASVLSRTRISGTDSNTPGKLTIKDDGQLAYSGNLTETAVFTGAGNNGWSMQIGIGFSRQ